MIHFCNFRPLPFVSLKQHKIDGGKVGQHQHLWSSNWNEAAKVFDRKSTGKSFEQISSQKDSTARDAIDWKSRIRVPRHLSKWKIWQRRQTRCMHVSVRKMFANTEKAKIKLRAIRSGRKLWISSIWEEKRSLMEFSQHTHAFASLASTSYAPESCRKEKNR